MDNAIRYKQATQKLWPFAAEAGEVSLFTMEEFMAYTLKTKQWEILLFYNDYELESQSQIKNIKYKSATPTEYHIAS